MYYSNFIASHYSNFLAAVDKVFRPLPSDTLERWAYIMGALGAILVATNTQISGYGFIAWVPANVFAVALMRRQRLNKMVLLYLMHTLITFLGIYRWFLS